MATRRLLLLSNSIQHGRGYLDHAEPHIRTFLGDRAFVAFIPYAAFDLDECEARARARLGAMEYELESFHRHHTEGDKQRLFEKATAIFIAGGNTFRLLHRLYAHDLIPAIRHRVLEGTAYIGASAGSIVAGPSIKTTKDMPVVEPPSFCALGLIPFHISPHYLDPDPKSTHMGETQEERIGHFLQENDGQVAGLREGSILSIRGQSVELLGAEPVRLFQRGTLPKECPPGPVNW